MSNDLMDHSAARDAEEYGRLVLLPAFAKAWAEKKHKDIAYAVTEWRNREVFPPVDGLLLDAAEGLVLAVVEVKSRNYSWAALQRLGDFFVQEVKAQHLVRSSLLLGCPSYLVTESSDGVRASWRIAESDGVPAFTWVCTKEKVRKNCTTGEFKEDKMAHLPLDKATIWGHRQP